MIAGQSAVCGGTDPGVDGRVVVSIAKPVWSAGGQRLYLSQSLDRVFLTHVPICLETFCGKRVQESFILQMIEFVGRAIGRGIRCPCLGSCGASRREQ